jgi:hypothetical protein
MHETIRIAPRFCGPPGNGNGGYVCGLLARHIEGDAEVTLRRPVPLERDLDVEVNADGVVLRNGDDVLAQAVPVSVSLTLPEVVSVDDARRVAGTARVMREPGLHPFPDCFACGPNRAAGDGLRLIPSAIDGRDVAAVEWVPDPSLAENGSNTVRREIVWSALDCPSSFAMYLEPELEGPYVLGRLAGHMETHVEVGRTYVATAWRDAVDGRKLFSGTAIRAEDGTPVAWARATWIRPAQ